MSKRLVLLVVVVTTLGLTIAIAPASSERERPRGRARLQNVDGDVVAVVRMIRTSDGKIDIRAYARAIEPADEFHGFHLHTTGECDPNAVDPETGEVVPFVSAGGHFNPTSEEHGDHAGDFPTLLVNADGTATLRFVTDRLKFGDVFDEDGSAVIIHAGRDNYANIPATTSTGRKRYHSHLEDVFGPDSETRATGDAGSRFACGVVKRITAG
jgi:superoxide dismutase, Cu-Zn family